MVYLCLVVRVSAARDNRSLAEAFLSLGIKAFFVASRGAAHDVLAQFKFNAILLDHETGPVTETVDLLKALANSGLPAFVLCDSASEIDQIRLLQAGAWEVMARAASNQLVAHKMIAAIKVPRGLQTEREMELLVGPLKLDALAMSASVQGEQLRLTPRQFELLFLLATRAGKLVHRKELERVTGSKMPNAKRALDMQLCRVRKCLRERGNRSLSIRSVYGFGYCLSIEDKRESYKIPLPGTTGLYSAAGEYGQDQVSIRRMSWL